MNPRPNVLITILLSLVLVNSACHRTGTSQPKRYPFTGRVISIDNPSNSALINGDNIPGFMDAMAMSYKVKPASMLRQLMPGDSISAEVVVIEPEGKADDEAASDYWLENVKVTAHAPSPPAKGASAMHLPQPGEDVPDFAFTNQDGKRISLHQFRGKFLVVTFIYTRCPFPDFCPRMSGNFAEIYKQSSESGPQLLSISFDPGHDTPKVLREYGFSVAHTHDPRTFRRWQFAAPASADLPKIADYFALTVQPEGGLITHNLSTAVIGPDGKIVSWYNGGDWQVSTLLKDCNVANAAAKP